MEKPVGKIWVGQRVERGNLCTCIYCIAAAPQACNRALYLYYTFWLPPSLPPVSGKALWQDEHGRPRQLCDQGQRQYQRYRWAGGAPLTLPGGEAHLLLQPVLRLQRGWQNRRKFPSGQQIWGQFWNFPGSRLCRSEWAPEEGGRVGGGGRGVHQHGRQQQGVLWVPPGTGISLHRITPKYFVPGVGWEEQGGIGGEKLGRGSCTQVWFHPFFCPDLVPMLPTA